MGQTVIDSISSAARQVPALMKDVKSLLQSTVYYVLAQQKPTGIFYLGRYFYSCFKKTQPVNHFCSEYANSSYRDTWLQSIVQKRDGCDSQTLLYVLRNNTK